jgi:hypothetical protein
MWRIYWLATHRSTTLETTSSTSRSSIRPRLEKLKIVRPYAYSRPLLTVLASPLVQSQVTFDEDLVPFAERLLDEIRLFSLFTPVKDIDVKKDRFVFPLARGRILSSIVHSKSEFSDLAAVGKSPHFRIAGQPADQQHLVQVRHVAVSCASEALLREYQTWF